MMIRVEMAALVLAGMTAQMLFAETVPLPEHPRPDWERAEWVNLNGVWDFGFKKGAYDRKITVPFGWGRRLSGVGDEGDIGYYRRTIGIPQEWRGRRVFLVIGASDWQTTVSLDGHRIGRHQGGYTPFEFELEDVRPGTTHVLEIEVDDTGAPWHLYGKQGYGNARGIWQTAYLEARGETYLESVRFSPHLATSSVTAKVALGEPALVPLEAAIEIEGRVTKVPFVAGEIEKSVEIALPDPKLWDIGNPHLYDVSMSVGDDRVKGYFGFREIGIGKNPAGEPCVTLNGKPIYLRMCLDQSYTPDGGYTFSSDEMMRNEILISKRLGLNANRVHVKAELPRKLYWADRLGLLVMADVPNPWGIACDLNCREMRDCFDGMLRRDFNHPSVFSWVLFNETWGALMRQDDSDGTVCQGELRADVQRQVARLYRYAKACDPTRLVEDNSPCCGDHTMTDLNTWHRYLPGFRWEIELSKKEADTHCGSRNNYAKRYRQTGAPLVNSECGNVWGYKGSTGDIDYTWDYHMMMNAFRRHLKCTGFLYTEHHDVEGEWNGYVRYDRTWKETGIGDLFPGMSLADLHGDAYLPLDVELCRAFAPGETYRLPVDVSVVSDGFGGRSLSVEWSLRYYDGEGRLVTTRPAAFCPRSAFSPWKCSRLADIDVTMPSAAACGTVCVTLKADGEAVARNFQCFVVRDPQPQPPVRPVASEWSLKSWEVFGGKKFCGAGKGWYEYEFDAPSGPCVFRAEVSAKRLNMKDAVGAAVGESEAVAVIGAGNRQRSLNPNSYPQTSAAHKFPGVVEVWVNGVRVKAVPLPDDPADHRGILSWFAQVRPKEFRAWPGNTELREAGSYGYLVEAEIPPDVVAKSRNGRMSVRLVAPSAAGLAVYNRDFGRFPFDPHLAEQ